MKVPLFTKLPPMLSKLVTLFVKVKDDKALIVKSAQAAVIPVIIGLFVTLGITTTSMPVGTAPVLQFEGVFQSVFVAPVQVV